MKIITVCGPYRADSDIGVYRNIERARQAAEQLWQAGFCAICLHKNTEFMSGLVEEEAFLEGGREIVRRSDGIFLLKGWEESAGSIEEYVTAKDAQIRIFYEAAPSVWEWLADWKRKGGGNE